MKYVGLYNENQDVATKKDVDIKQDKITTSGILKGDGAGGVAAAVANTDYATCTNLRNGSVEGSIRTISATEESSTYTIGAYALAEGYDTRSSGNYSHAEAYRTKASGAQSHAEGSWTQALDSSSHSEGNRTIASAEFSHAEGDSTTAQGKTSHSEGTETIANHLSQHVQGEYNIADASTAVATERGNYVHIVGNGTASNARSNAHTLDWSGNAWFAGDVYVGSTSGTNKDEGSKKLITADEVPKGAVYTATLTAAGWQTSGAWKTQTVSVTGLKASYNAAPFVDVALSGTDATADAELAAAWLGISATAIADTAANSLTVKFPATVDTPTVNIPIRVTTYD